MIRSLSVVLCIVLLSGCAASKFGVNVNPLTGTIGATFETDGTTASVATTIPATKYIRAVDECGNTRLLTRSLSRVEVQTAYGRGLAPWLSTRGLGDERSLARECKSVQRDLRIEKRNADVSLDYTSRRSMSSSFRAFFGYHRTLCPLAQNGSIVIESPVEVVTQPPVNLPSVDPGLPPSGIIPPPDAATKSLSNLEVRVNALENHVSQIDTTLNRLQIDVSKILAAVEKK